MNDGVFKFIHLKSRQKRAVIHKYLYTVFYYNQHISSKIDKMDLLAYNAPVVY